jgi:universal stress protein A
VEVAKQLDVDLIVIATHGYTGWKHCRIGSTAERVMRSALCPVFVVREKEHDFV